MVSCPGGSPVATVTSPTPSPTPDTTVSYRLNGLTTGVTYVVGVTAVDGSGNESECAMASAVARIDFAVSPAGTLNFGSVNLGQFADATFTVTNTVDGTVSGTVSTSSPFSVVSGSPFTLAGVGASQAVTVRFRPTISATATANVNFTAAGGIISRILAGAATDATPPTVAVTSPTTTGGIYTTSGSTVTLEGTAADDIGLTQVTWMNSRGSSGVASGTTSWTAGVVLQPGANLLTVTAHDAAGNTGTASLTVTFNDPTHPAVAITSPTTDATYTTGNSLMTLEGTASIGVTQVTWVNNLTGREGPADGTTSWRVAGIVLLPGANVLTITARDAAGTTGTVTLTVMSCRHANDFCR